jgi:hypothetical protein
MRLVTVECVPRLLTAEQKNDRVSICTDLSDRAKNDPNIIYFNIKKLNWASYLERCVTGMRQFIIKVDLSTLTHVRTGHKKISRNKRQTYGIILLYGTHILL